MEPSDASIIHRTLRRARPMAARQLRAVHLAQQAQRLQAQQEVQQQIDSELRERLLALAEMQHAFIRDIRSRELGVEHGQSTEIERRLDEALELEKKALHRFFKPNSYVYASEEALKARADTPRRPEYVSYPEWATCPIKLAPFVDPVIASDGHTYERLAIKKWFESGKHVSPITNEFMSPTVLSNFAMRKAVDCLSEEGKER